MSPIVANLSVHIPDPIPSLSNPFPDGNFENHFLTAEVDDEEKFRTNSTPLIPLLNYCSYAIALLISISSKADFFNSHDLNLLSPYAAEKNEKLDTVEAGVFEWLTADINSPF
jgi:hypothetical protein